MRNTILPPLLQTPSSIKQTLSKSGDWLSGPHEKPETRPRSSLRRRWGFLKDTSCSWNRTSVNPRCPLPPAWLAFSACPSTNWRRGQRHPEPREGRQASVGALPPGAAPPDLPLPATSTPAGRCRRSTACLRWSPAGAGAPRWASFGGHRIHRGESCPSGRRNASARPRSGSRPNNHPHSHENRQQFAHGGTLPPFHSKVAIGAWSVSKRHDGQCRSRCPDCTRHRGGLKIRTISAEESLQAGDIGLIRWVPRTQRQDRFRPMRHAPARWPRGDKGAGPQRDRKEDDVPIPLFFAPESPARRAIRRPSLAALNESR